MLELRPNCEYCDKDLPPAATDARICTYQCTFCADCVERVLFNVCPNCGGGFVPRPIRPITERRPGVCLGKQPASTNRVHLKWDRAELAEFVRSLRDIEPEDRQPRRVTCRGRQYRFDHRNSASMSLMRRNRR